MTAYSQTLTTADECIAFIKALIADGKAWHFDDDPADLTSNIFTAAECADLRLRVDEMREIIGDEAMFGVLIDAYHPDAA